MDPIRITHIITGLSIGGAEKVLFRLVREMNQDHFENSVISLTELGPLGKQLKAEGMPVSAMNFNRGSANVIPIAQLALAIRKTKPTVVQTWMYHADLIGGFASSLVTNAPVLWNLRQSTLDRQYSKPSTIRTAKACSHISHYLPNTIVCGSESARIVHTNMGYDFTKMVVLHNGFDTNRYTRSEVERKQFRARLGISDNEIVIGNPSRFDPQKDHHTFIEAARFVVQHVPKARFILCGDNVTTDNTQLMQVIRNAGLEDRINLLGIVDDITKLYSSLDILALSSAYGEGAPNVLGEAMSACVPCVATDIGDSAHIIGETGSTVPPRDVGALVRELIALANIPETRRHEIGRLSRERISKNFPLQTMIQRYEHLYRRVNSQINDF